MQHNRLLSGICILMSNVWILKQNQFRTIALISFIFMVMITVYGYRISLNMQRILDFFLNVTGIAVTLPTCTIQTHIS